jgi:hypothetical protein
MSWIIVGGAGKTLLPRPPSACVCLIAASDIVRSGAERAAAGTSLPRPPTWRRVRICIRDTVCGRGGESKCVCRAESGAKKRGRKAEDLVPAAAERVADGRHALDGAAQVGR